MFINREIQIKSRERRHMISGLTVTVAIIGTISIGSFVTRGMPTSNMLVGRVSALLYPASGPKCLSDDRVGALDVEDPVHLKGIKAGTSTWGYLMEQSEMYGMFCVYPVMLTHLDSFIHTSLGSLQFYWVNTR